MSAFTSSAAIEPLPNGRWRLTAPLVWELGRKDSGLAFVAPAGFETDLASIPAMARMLLDRGDARIAKAAILHDAMLADPGWSGATAAAEFHGALRAGGVGRGRAAIMALAVLAWSIVTDREAGTRS